MTDTTDLSDFDDLAARLVDLGDALDVDDSTATVDAVLARLDSGDPRRPTRSRRLVLAAAAVLLVAAVGVLVVPDARSAVARWFGIEGVEVEIDPTGGWAPVFEAPPVGQVRTVDIAGREVTIATLEGRLDEILIRKTVVSADQIREVNVDGNDGLWISGEPHQVVVETADGSVDSIATAGNTLLWSDGSSIFRVEGFDRFEDALAYVEFD